VYLSVVIGRVFGRQYLEGLGGGVVRLNPDPTAEFLVDGDEKSKMFGQET
jgi:hypothetical protein